MKSASRRRPVKGTPAPPPRKSRRRWYVTAALLAVLLVVFEAYRPAMRGPFLLDDNYLTYARPDAAQLDLTEWVRYGRPVLQVTFWMNFQRTGADPYPFHVWNVVIHWLTAVLVWVLVRRVLAWAGQPDATHEALAAFAAGLFLLHPLQTEAVAYVASRSDLLSTFFCYAALAVFVCRRRAAIGAPTALLLLMLCGAAVLSKEHAAVLPAAFLLTDYFWNPGFSFSGARKNWKLYGPLVLLGAAGARFVWQVLAGADTAGFAMKDLTWYQYFFTQCRAIWLYLRLFVLPYGQNIDADFPISRTVIEHGAVFGLLALLAVAAVALCYRKRYPLACYGLLVFLLLIAPTSSFAPIRDPIAERRVYLPMIGLLLILVDLVRRWRIGFSTLAGGAAVVLALCAWLTHERSRVYASPLLMWQDAVAKSPRKARPHFQLAFAHYQLGQCAEALPHYQQAAELGPVETRLLVDWSLALDCAGRPAEAVAKLRQAAAIENSAHINATLGMVFGKQGRTAEALAALAEAEKLDGQFVMTYVYRGNVYAARGMLEQAAAEYKRALSLAPDNQAAQAALFQFEQRKGQAR